MKPHIVALDVDGTIVSYDDSLSDAVRATVQAVDAAGHHIVIATGRSASGALDTANRLGLTRGMLVCSNGAVIVRLDEDSPRGWEVDHVETFDPAPALERMVDVLPTALYMVEDAQLTRFSTGEFPVGELADMKDMRIVSFDELKARPATRIVLRDPHGSEDEFADAVERIGLHGVTYSVGWSNWLDISPEGVSKASGLERVRGILGIDRDATVCAGDGSNDIEMMEWAQHGIAMGQAVSDLKALATVVTGRVDEDGLVTALGEYFGV